MALAVTHVLLTIVILDLFRHYVFGKKKFPRYLIVVGGIAGLLPDIDVPISWLLSFLSGTTIDLHRLFTHSVFFVLLFLLLAIVFQYSQKNMKWAKIFYAITVGWAFHLVLDCFYGDSWSSILWPLSFFLSFCPTWDIHPYASGIDAIILVLWLVHEEAHSYITDYF